MRVKDHEYLAPMLGGVLPAWVAEWNVLTSEDSVDIMESLNKAEDRLRATNKLESGQPLDEESVIYRVIPDGFLILGPVKVAILKLGVTIRDLSQ
jgi:hypothetical protein